MVGYQSEAAFQRAFKQHAGMTPSQWRRAMKPRENQAVKLRQRSQSRGTASSEQASPGSDQDSSGACADAKFSV
jgi:AraC family transcriptional activator of mtrCDE